MHIIKTIVIGSLCLAMAWGYYTKTIHVTVSINDASFTVRTHYRDVASLLEQLDLSLRPDDLIEPGLDANLIPEQPRQITLSRPIEVVGDQTQPDNRQRIYTHLETPKQIYNSLGVPLSAADNVFVDDQIWPHNQSLPKFFPKPTNTQINVATLRPPVLHLTAQRAVPVHIIDDGQETTVLTTLATVEALLQAENITLFDGDRLNVDTQVRLKADAIINIERAVPISIQMDGRIVPVRTLQKTVRTVLAQEGIILSGLDYTRPEGSVAIQPGMKIQVVRVEEALSVSQERADYETLWLPDEALEIDNQDSPARTRWCYQNTNALAI